MSNSSVTESEILERFAGIVARSLRIAPERVTADAHLSDLGAESLDLLEIAIDIEDEFAIVVPQADILQVAQEVFGPDVVVRDEVLTARGAEFLRRRMAHVSGAIASGMPVADARRLFQGVGTWVHMIQGLLEQSPKSCPACAAVLARPMAGRMKCTGCGAEVDLPSGDQLNRRWVEDYYRNEQGLESDEGARVARTTPASA